MTLLRTPTHLLNSSTGIHFLSIHDHEPEESPELSAGCQARLIGLATESPFPPQQKSKNQTHPMTKPLTLFSKLGKGDNNLVFTNN